MKTIAEISPEWVEDPRIVVSQSDQIQYTDSNINTYNDLNNNITRDEVIRALGSYSESSFIDKSAFKSGL